MHKVQVGSGSYVAARPDQKFLPDQSINGWSSFKRRVFPLFLCPQFSAFTSPVMLRAHSNKESRACLSVRFPELEKRLEIGSRTKYKMIERMRERCNDPLWSERIATWPELHPPTHFVLFGKSLPYVTAKILTWFDTDIHPKSEKLCGLSIFSFIFSPKNFSEKVCKSQR